MSKPITLAEISKAAAGQGGATALGLGRGRWGRKPDDPVQLKEYEEALDRAKARKRSPSPPKKTLKGFKAELAEAKAKAVAAAKTAAAAEAYYQEQLAAAAKRREAEVAQKAVAARMANHEKAEKRVAQKKADDQEAKDAAEKQRRAIAMEVAQGVRKK